MTTCACAEQASVQIPRFVPDREYSAAHAETSSSLLWQNAPLTQAAQQKQPSEMELRQSIRAFVMDEPALGPLYALRQLVKGNSQRQWKISPTSASEFRLALGGQSLPVFQLTGVNGSRAAVALTSNSFGLYSTRPLRALNNELKTADLALGDAVSNDASEMDWLSARPFSSARGTLEVVFLRGQNDLSPYSPIKTSRQFSRGAMAGAKVAYLLPLRWNMNGEWMTGGVESANREADDAGSLIDNSAYVLTLAGPITHPFGETGVRFSRRAVGAHFQNFSGALGDTGVASTQISLNQPFKIGTVSGAIEWNCAQQLSADQSTPVAVNKANLQANSNIRWQATPIVAITASHRIGSDVTARNVEIAPIYDAHRNSASQIGVEWRVLPGISFSLNGGETRYEETSDGERFLRRMSNRDQQLSLGLRGQSSVASWDLHLERRAALNVLGETGQSTQGISFNTQRQLAPWLQMRGSYRLNQNRHIQGDEFINANSSLASGLTAGASLSLAQLGALELNYSQSNNARNDGLRWNNSLSRGYGARYVYGARGGQNGLGLSLDYSCNAVNNLNNSQWQLGITYR